MTKGGCLALLILLAPLGARAQLGRVIEPGREVEIQALFAPHRLGEDVQPGWRFAGISIEPQRIDANVSGPEGARATLSLGPPSGTPDTASFALARSGDGSAGARAALDALAEAVRRNDRGTFWADTAVAGIDHPMVAWAGDGLLHLLLGLALLITLSVRALRGEPRPVWVALLAIVVAGVVLRLTLSPETIFEAWSYSRIHPLAARVDDGPLLSWITGVLGARAMQQELIFRVTLVCAIATPAAVFLQARALFSSCRFGPGPSSPPAATAVGLVAAGILTVLPHHLRFSHSDTAFVASIAMSSLCDVLVHVACTDASRRWRIFAGVALLPLLYAMLQMRPLNVLFLPLFLVHAVAFVGSETPRRRRAILAAAIAVVGAASVATHLLVHYPREVLDTDYLRVVLEGIGALFTPRYDTLIHPWITPPLLTALALAGAVFLARRGERTRSAYLIGWLLAFFIAHAFALPGEIAMQARYHLHVILPFVFLAAAALVALHARAPRLALAAAAVLALSPLVHFDFIRDLDFDDQRENAFARGLRARIPAQCTVAEYLGGRFRTEDARLPRIGAMIDAGHPSSLWQVHPTRDAAGGIATLDRASRTGCAVWYRGLLCYAEKRRSEPIAEACAEIEAHFAGRLRPLSRRTFPHRFYDENLASGLRGVPDATVSLAAFRVAPPAPGS